MLVDQGLLFLELFLEIVVEALDVIIFFLQHVLFLTKNIDLLFELFLVCVQVFHCSQQFFLYGGECIIDLILQLLDNIVNALVFLEGQWRFDGSQFIHILSVKCLNIVVLIEDSPRSSTSSTAILPRPVRFARLFAQTLLPPPGILVQVRVVVHD